MFYCRFLKLLHTDTDNNLKYITTLGKMGVLKPRSKKCNTKSCKNVYL